MTDFIDNLRKLQSLYNIPPLNLHIEKKDIHLFEEYKDIMHIDFDDNDPSDTIKIFYKRYITIYAGEFNKNIKIAFFYENGKWIYNDYINYI